MISNVTLDNSNFIGTGVFPSADLCNFSISESVHFTKEGMSPLRNLRNTLTISYLRLYINIVLLN